MKKNQLKNSNVIVTGGCGFIGSALVRRLLKEGVRSIVVVDSLEYGNVENIPHSSKIKLVKFLIGTDSTKRLEKYFSNADYLFHLAAEKHNQSKDRPEKIMRTNIDGTYQLFSLAAKTGIKKILFTSSLYAYGRMSGKSFSESDQLEPKTLYGVSKATGEHFLRYFSSRGLETIVLRYFFVYGPNQFAGTGYKSVIIKNFERILNGNPPIVNGNGNQILDYIYIDDAVEGTIRAFQSQNVFDAFNIASGKGVSINQLVRLMQKVSVFNQKTIRAPADETAGSRRVGSTKKTLNELNFKPKISLEQGLRRTFQWIKEHEVKSF